MPVETLTDARVRGLKADDGEVIDAKSGLIARADGTGAISFSFRYRRSAVRRRLTLGRFPQMSLAEARAEATHLREQVRTGVDPQQERRDARDAPAGLSFDALADSYIERYAKIQKSSWKNDEHYLRFYARPVWGKREAAAITRQDAARLLFDIVPRAPVSANRLKSVLAKLFGWAVDSALLADSPMLGVKKPHREGQGKTRVLDDAEIKVLWHALAQANAAPGIVGALRVLLLVGARPGEVSGMAVAELRHLDDPRTACWELPPERTKARKAHVVPLPPLVRDIIRTELARQTKPEFVFVSPVAGCKQLTRHSLARVLANVIDRLDADAETVARLQAARPTPHDFRRSVATNLSKLGILRETRLAVLGHAHGDVHEIYDRYDRLAEKRIALELWERHLRKVIDGDPGGADIVPLRTAVPL